VRTFFNDFWVGVSDKPGAFVERLDQAEDYLNERLAANGELWRVDAKSRPMLGLPLCAKNRASSRHRDKSLGEAPAALVETVARGSAPLIEWLTERHALPFELIENFNYPGHSALRMHGLPSRTGRELIDRLRNAAELNELVVLTRCIAETLFAERDGQCPQPRHRQWRFRHRDARYLHGR
jgi:hypothetical protein